jgi:TPR repeat protein
VTWYRKAARRNDVGALFMMGRAYEYGEGVRSNAARALGWYARAARLGDEEARVALSQLRKQR